MKKITPLKEKFNALPRTTTIEKDIEPALKNEGVSIATFYRDLKTDAKNIPTGRLQLYAALLGCDVSDLFDSFVKIKPIVKKQKSFVLKPNLKS